jgi:PAS domain S-box-containing protein
MPQSAKNNKENGQAIFKIALAGQGPAMLPLCRILNSVNFKAAFPNVRPAALLLAQGDLRPEFRPYLPEKINLYRSAAELFANEENLRLILNTGPGSAGEAELRAHAPLGVNILSPSAVVFICRAIEKDLLSLDGGARIERIRHSFVTLIDQMDSEVLVIDEDGSIAEVNSYFLKVWGGIREDYLGRHCREIMGPAYCCDKQENDACPWTLPFEERRNTTKVYNVVNKNGQLEYYRVVFFPLPPEQDQKYSLFMRKNITDIIQMEQKLQQSQKMAAIGELSTYIAHEIRNPLFALGGFANSLLRTPNLDEAAKEKAGIILEESQRLDNILKSIINFAKPGDQENIEEINLAAMLEEVLKLMRTEPGGDKYICATNISPLLPRARGNKDHLKQVFVNIIKNAQEAMPEGGEIQVTAGTKGHMLEVLIRDNGPGIPVEEQEKAFSPFYSTKGKGAGLGLTMCRKFIDDMGGQLQLESEPGQGATLRVLLLPALAVQSSSLHIVSSPGQGTSITMKIPPGA